MIAIALIHLCFGSESPVSYVKIKFDYFFFFLATTGLTSKMIHVNITTVWKEFSQYIYSIRNTI